MLRRRCLSSISVDILNWISGYLESSWGLSFRYSLIVLVFVFLLILIFALFFECYVIKQLISLVGFSPLYFYVARQSPNEDTQQ